jgi:putative sterol carrier protein
MTAQDFLAGLPAQIAPEALVGIDTIFHFNLDGGALQKTVTVANGKLDVVDGLLGEAKCVVSAKSDLLMKVIKREENPMMAVMMGKIKISNVNEMMKFAKIFGIM